jgi:GntR family transcriptional regulator
MEVDRASPRAPYLQLADQLIAGIRAGEYDYRLPSATHIAQSAGVAQMTARKALRVVVDAGHAYVAVGMGTYVRGDADTPPDLPG